MFAITLTHFGGPENLRWSEVPDPVPQAHEVLIDIAATAINRADVLQRQGHYPPPPGTSDILGLECSGIISAVGTGVTQWTIGDHVCALLSGGGYAQRVAVPAQQVMPIPSGIDLYSAATLPEVACTVWSNLVLTAKSHAGQKILIHGGSSGVGTHGIQIAKSLGLHVSVTAGSSEKLTLCRELGADIAINYRQEDFVEALAAHRPNIILDNMGASYLDRNIEALAPDGHLIIIGMQGGTVGELNLGKLLTKRGRITATSLRGRPTHGKSSKAEVVHDVVKYVWPLVESAEVQPIIHCELDIQEVQAAHKLLESGKTMGKILLRVN
ncbi:MAG: NAD(P)H-quinone oxidoreductase [Mycobacteriaceae bacterium]